MDINQEIAKRRKALGIKPVALKHREERCFKAMIEQGRFHTAPKRFLPAGPGVALATDETELAKAGDFATRRIAALKISLTIKGERKTLTLMGECRRIHGGKGYFYCRAFSPAGEDMGVTYFGWWSLDRVKWVGEEVAHAKRGLNVPAPRAPYQLRVGAPMDNRARELFQQSR